MLEIQQITFWGPMDADTEAFVQAKTTEIHACMNRTAEGIIATGNALMEVRDRLPYEQFLSWAESEFDMRKSTAHRYMAIARRFGEEVPRGGLPVHVLELLASPSMPDEVIEQVTSGQIPASLPAIREAKAALLPPVQQPIAPAPSSNGTYIPRPAPVTQFYEPHTEALPSGLGFMAQHLAAPPEINAQEEFARQWSRLLSAFPWHDDDLISEGIMASTDEQLARYETHAHMIQRQMALLLEQVSLRRRTVLSVISKKDQE